MPTELSERLRGAHIPHESWGRLKVTAQIGQTEWKTSVWYDAKSGSYQLPIKASVRKSERIDTDDVAAVSIMF